MKLRREPKRSWKAFNPDDERIDHKATREEEEEADHEHLKLEDHEQGQGNQLQ
jgi:hypothetical protein